MTPTYPPGSILEGCVRDVALGRIASHGSVTDEMVAEWQSLHPEAPETITAVPNTPGTPRRTIRVPDALWDAASEKAKEQGTDVSSVIRKALERYVRRNQ